MINEYGKQGRSLVLLVLHFLNFSASYIKSNFKGSLLETKGHQFGKSQVKNLLLSIEDSKVYFSYTDQISRLLDQIFNNSTGRQPSTGYESSTGRESSTPTAILKV